jgi:putative acyl-CoA dehydrogenase
MKWPTHEVSNQAPRLADVNFYGRDTALQQAVAGSPAAAAHAGLMQIGAELGTADMLDAAEEANRHTPQWQGFDAHGNRLDRVQFHPAWHRLLAALCQHGMHNAAWLQPSPSAHLQRAAGYYLHAQLESGSMCPVTMSFAALPLLARETALYPQLQSQLSSTQYDARDLPLAHKHGMLVGMGMTEKQGGSDVRSNSTVARPAGGAEGRGAPYLLTGHKWFFSAPMCDAHLVLARTEAGLSCFYVPRFAPDGSKNAVLVQQLKDKLGNRSNASSEVEFQDAWGLMLGEEGRGIPTIIEMAGVTRVDCVIGSAGLMRAALIHAIHHCRYRSAFGKPLLQQPLMKNVLCDLALEAEAAMHLMLYLAHSLDQADDPLQQAVKRVLTPAAKFWICKRALEFTGECMETWGGNGYVETGPLARFYREAPVNSIWEGSGNVMCLDVLRAIERDPPGFAQLLHSLNATAREHTGLQTLLQRLQRTLSEGAALETQARRIAQDLVLLVQGSLMLQHAPADMADAFLATRVDAAHGRVFGALPAHYVRDAWLTRAWPED